MSNARKTGLAATTSGALNGGSPKRIPEPEEPKGEDHNRCDACEDEEQIPLLKAVPRDHAEEAPNGKVRNREERIGESLEGR